MSAAPPSPVPPTSDLLDGEARQLGPYRLVRLLGRGGMGTVYEAVHSTIGHRVAIKRLHQSADEQATRRLLREARALGAVVHPGLVRILDVLLAPHGAPCLVLEHLDGQTLRARSGSPIGLLEVATMGQQIATAMIAAHAHGVVHRDLKPENVMLVKDLEVPGGERVKILDFGIARLTDRPELATRTEDGLLLCGTPAYMSPEQCTGELPATEKSDVYALGIVLYELLCGQPPFIGEPSRLVRMHAFASPSPPSKLRPDIPAALERLILRMLAKMPARRPTMTEVATALGRPLRPARPGTRVAKRLGMLIGLGSLALSLSVLLVLSWPLRGQVLIPGGEFTQGTSEAAIADRLRAENDAKQQEIIRREGPERRVRISPFLLDRTEVPSVLVAEWLNRELAAGRACADFREKIRNVEVYEMTPDPEGYCPSGPPRDRMLLEVDDKQKFYGPRYNPRTARFELDNDLRNAPAVLLTNYGARRFCESIGKRLPTEAEWEFAARGPSGQLYPWGKREPGCRSAVFARPKGSKCHELGERPDAVDAPTEDVSPFGVLHMAGNVGEWVQDQYTGRYAPCPEGVCVDPQVQAGPTTAPHVWRGGTWHMQQDLLIATGRGIGPYPTQPGEPPNSPSIGDVGLRCARSLQEVRQPLRILLQAWSARSAAQ